MARLAKSNPNKRSTANLLCLLPGKGPFETGLRQRLGDILDGAPVEHCDNLTSLFARLRQQACYSAVVMLLETDSKLLDQLLAQQELLTDVPLVLLVPDKKRSTLAKGHLLRPRFMASPADDPELIKEVLANILNRRHKENQAAVRC